MTTAPALEATEDPKPTLLAEVLDILRTVALALLIALVLRVVVFQPYTIPSSSMEPGLVTGDYVVVSKFSYGWSRASFPFNPPLFKGRMLGTGPKRGDVLVFRDAITPDKALIKRVIGLPGDRVQVVGGQLWVNGQAVPRTVIGPATDRDAPDVTPTRIDERAPDGRTYATFDRGTGYQGDDTEIYQVPAGRYFMMGDNRDNSADSRWPEGTGVGFVPAEAIVGRAEFVAASWNKGAGLFKPWTWLDLQWDRFFKRIK